jgi:hypothetical protein
MGEIERGSLPADLQRARNRFQTWRKRRKRGTCIPHPLWTLAVGLAGTHGVNRTARTLGLDYYSLKKRADAPATESPPSGGPMFVELPAPAMVAKQCQVELDNGSGRTMRVQLVGYDAADIEALARGFWNAR